MKIERILPSTLAILLLYSICLASCNVSRRMDKYVAGQFGNELPKPKKNKAGIIVNSVYSTANDAICTTVQKTSHILPLLVYFQFDYRHTCHLNPLIGVTQFANDINSQSAKLSQKLNGQTLELTVEQVPSAFALVDKSHILFLTITWDRIYVEPDFKDLIVSYKLLQNNTVTQKGQIDIKNNERDRGIRLFQSWKSSVREYLSSYNSNMAQMTKELLSQLSEKLQ